MKFTKVSELLRIGVLGIFLAATLSGCVVVGGYRSGGGWFFWPGGLGLAIMVVLWLLFTFLRRGR